ncbi:MAG: MazG nucleotide pyrophosphohydrolase domain-containing protein [Acidimicrobiales bacterium]|jgi:tetrapyrrole methylase family protein/MazG family protein
MITSRDSQPTVVVVGLGPAGPEHTTPVAAEALSGAAVAYLRTSRHPAAKAWLGRDNVVALDECYESGATFEGVYRSIVERVVEGALDHGRVAFAVPGSPSVAERTVELLRAEPSITVEVVPGLSFCELAWVRLGVDPLEAAVRLVDAESFAVQAAGDAGPLLVGQCWSKDVLSSIKLCFDLDPGPAVLLHHLGLTDEVVVEVPWSEIDRTLEADHLTSLYVPRIGAPVARELTRFAELVRVLRARCPWDREQTHLSLVQHLLEETYEAMEAIEMLGDDPSGASPEVVAHVSEELGDILCQIMFHTTLAEEEGLFNLADVARQVHDKLVARHPHVFGDETATTPGAVLLNWERNKQTEKMRTHLFEGIPAAMPALAKAAKVERKLASVELGWAATGLDAGALIVALAGMLRLTDESAGVDEDTARAVGALLLELARLVAHRGEDPEALLRHAIDRLGSRVAGVEAAARESGADLTALAPALRVELWRATDTHT